jgi:DnaJ-class molecular chaperone
LAFMTIRRSFEILELEPGATLNDARQAYKDIANVWHPDRFAANPRLKHKAEQKLKEVNVAYETAKAFFQKSTLSNNTVKEEVDDTSRQTHHGNYGKGQQAAKERSRTEIAAEVGTALILSFCSYVSAQLHHFVEKKRP